MPEPSPTIADKRCAFRQLHASGCFVIPNPWDVGGARYLQSLGFKALATTSSGFAWSQGRPDGSSSREAVLAHLREIVAATDVPINADFESGFARDPAGVAQSVRLAIETGVAGLSIEDSTGDAARPLYASDEAVARLRAAGGAIDRAGGDVLLVGRAECFLVGRPDLDETIARLTAYANAGADCLHAPGHSASASIASVIGRPWRGRGKLCVEIQATGGLGGGVAAIPHPRSLRNAREVSRVVRRAPASKAGPRGRAAAGAAGPGFAQHSPVARAGLSSVATRSGGSR